MPKVKITNQNSKKENKISHKVDKSKIKISTELYLDLLAETVVRDYRSNERKYTNVTNLIDGLYEEFGYYLNQTYSFEFGGAAGMQKMADIMTAVRDNTPKSIAGYDVVKVSDYFLRKETDVATGSVTDIDLPKSNVIALHLADDNAVIIRPSGTEPKIKLYITSVGKDKDNAAEICEKLVVASKEILGIE